MTPVTELMQIRRDITRLLVGRLGLDPGTLGLRRNSRAYSRIIWLRWKPILVLAITRAKKVKQSPQRFL